MELWFRIPIVCGITDSLRCIFRIPKPRIPDFRTKICWISNYTSQNFSDSGIRNPLLERQITLSGNLRTKQEYLLCSKLCSTIWTLHRKIFWKKILIMENDLVIKSRISEVLSQLKAKPSGHPPSNLYQIWQFYAFPGISLSTTLFTVQFRKLVARKREKCRTDSLFKDLKSWDKFVLLTLIYRTYGQLGAKGLTKCVRYTEVSFFRVIFFFFMYFTVSGLKNIVRYTEHFVIWRFRYIVVPLYTCPPHPHPAYIISNTCTLSLRWVSILVHLFIGKGWGVG